MIDPIEMADRLTALWAKMIDAPLEKIVNETCESEAQELLAKLNEGAAPAQEYDVLVALKAVAVAFDLAPPSGAQLKIYLRVLGELPVAVLQQVTEQLIKEYRYPTFPRPIEWRERAQDRLRLIEKARLLMRIYAQRRKLAEMKYGR